MRITVKMHKRFSTIFLCALTLCLGTAVCDVSARPASKSRQRSTSRRPLVRTPAGDVQGVLATWKNGRQYQAFRGIPFARPPVGDLRLAKPQPHPGINGVHDASEYAPMCPQYTYGVDVPTSEDCLYLNVFVPARQTTDRRGRQRTGNDLYPVQIFIHGGGFYEGSPNKYEPGKMVSEDDVIVVTITYRVNVFGFLSTGDDVLPGNYGLWDQHLAIKWVKDNIRSFGGDPDQMTLSGLSAGSMSVSLHSLSPLSKGLFHRAVMQSGTTATWLMQHHPADVTNRVLARLGCPPYVKENATSGEEMVTCLRNQTPDALSNASELLHPRPLTSQVIDFVYLPVADGVFLPDDPQNLLKDKQYLGQVGFYERDYLQGVVNNEGGMIYLMAPFTLPPMNESELFTPEFFDEGLVRTLLTLTGGSHPVLEKTVTFFHTYPRYPDKPLLDIQGVLDTVSDVGFVAPMIHFARAVAARRTSDKKNLVYLFNHFPQFMTGDVKGIHHATDVIYQFDMGPEGVWYTGTDVSLWNEDDDWMAQAFRDVILEFVKTGDPANTLNLPGGWPDFDLTHESYLSLSPSNTTVGQHMHGHGVSLWLDLLPDLRSQLNEN